MEIKIVEYNHTYAEKVADMWNKSASNWGNDDTVRTAEEVIKQESSSGNLKLYLALDGEEVVGYCSFSEYRMDEGASYLPLLNVRPDYHGKKVGKKLILTVIEDAIKAEWPRFDLFTWSGNLKAVPLYKKCGFFWEKKNDTVHLMNFLPYVYKTEAVKEYLDVIDWYKDSKRKIELVPDGREENGFEFYEYIFEKDDINLRMEFERKGRGLRLIETNDYLIKASIDKQSLVFGFDYKINFEIINKTGKELNIGLNGLKDKNINFDINESLKVDDLLVVEGEFNVGRIEEEVNTWNTHPTVSTEVTINGKKALFKLGIEPKAPVNLKLNVPNQSNRLGAEYTSYLDIENGFEKDIEISFTLPSNDNVNFLTDIQKLKLSSKEKTSIPLTYKLSNYGLYDNEVDYLIKVDGIETKYTKKLTSIFRGDYGKFYGELDKDYFIVNGEYVVIYDHLEKDLFLKKDTSSEEVSIVLPIKIGLPYSLEFSRLEPVSVDYKTGNDLIEMKLNFASRDFSGLHVSMVCELTPNGILKVYYLVENTSHLRENLKFSKGVYQQLSDSYIPYKNNILKINGFDGSGMSYYDDKYLDENWLFKDDGESTGGVCWDNSEDAKLSRWFVSLEEEIGTLDKGGIFTSKPIYVSLAHKNVDDFRRFALAKFNIEDKKESNIIDYTVNGGNPFIKDKYDLVIKNNRNMNLEGKLFVNDISKVVNGNSVSIELDALEFKTELDLKDRIESREFMVFKTHESKVKTYKETLEGKEVLVADNGLIKIKSSKDYSDCLFSINYDSKEWLDSNFPTPAQKAWWNPWVGGINLRPVRMQDNVVLQEQINAEFIDVLDNFNNLWTGIKTTVNFTKEDKYKGLTIENYYLLMPGTKVLLSTSKIIQNTGAYLNSTRFIRTNALKIDTEITKSKFVVNEANKLTKYKCGDLAVAVKAEGMLTIESERKSKLILYRADNAGIQAETQPDLCVAFAHEKLRIPNGESKFTKNDFLIFSDDYIDKTKLKDLDNIKL